MPGWTEHATCGMVLLITMLVLNYFCNFFPFTFTLLDFLLIPIVAFIYSLLPDCDIRNSKIYGVILTTFLIGIIYCFLVGLAWYGIGLAVVLIIISSLKHRGVMHTILAGIILSLPLLYFGGFYMVLGLMCIIAHLILDMELKIY